MIKLKKLGYFALYGVIGGVFLGLTSVSAWAQGGQGEGMNDIVYNIGASVQDMPGLLSAVAYLFAILMGSWGVLDMVKHVENSGNMPLRNPLTKFATGGMGFALPSIFNSMRNTINGGADATTNTGLFDLGQNVGLSQSAVGGGTINDLFYNIIYSVQDMPGIVTITAYLLAMVIGLSGVIKLREYVESQGKDAPMRSVVISFLASGSLFALPTILGVISNTISGGVVIGDITGGVDPMVAGETNESCNETDESTVGAAICMLTKSTAGAPALLAAASYLFGITLGTWGIFKIKEHVNNPSQTPIWEGISRFIAGGSFLTLPFVVYTIRTSLMGTTDDGNPSKISAQGFNNEGASGSCAGGEDLGGLDSVLNCFMTDIYGPMNVVVTVFGIIAGIIFIMIGISRLIKGAQEGAKAPGGLGTIMTFITGAALLSANPIMKALSMSIFGNPLASTFAELAYTEGMTGDEVSHANAVIAAILMFLGVVGFISLVRGIFILRGVAEGNSQSSMMAAITHMVGGALAVNMGGLLTAVQTTLGIEGTYGITFS